VPTQGPYVLKDIYDGDVNGFDGEINVISSLWALSLAYDQVYAHDTEGTQVDSGAIKVVLAGGVGSGFSFQTPDLDFDDNLQVNLRLIADDDAADGTVDGTVTLHASLQNLATLGIDRVESHALSGVDAVIVDGGVGSFDLTQASVTFDPTLDVTLQLTAADDGADGTVDGTVTLGASLQNLVALGIDHIEAGSQSGVDVVVLTGGLGGEDFTSQSLAFDAPLDVTLQLTAADDLADGTVDGTVTLGASLQNLVALGIDHIEAGSQSGVDAVVLTGGLGGVDLTAQSFAFDAPLDVTLQLAAGDDGADGSVDGTVMLGTSLHGMLSLGIDKWSADGTGVDSIQITGGVGTGNGQPAHPIELSGAELGLEMSQAEISQLVDLIDSGLSFQGHADLSIHSVAETSLGDLSLSKLADLGIDHVKISTTSVLPKVHVEAGLPSGLSDADLQSALDALVHRFEPASQPLFHDGVDVALDIGSNSLAALQGATQLMEEIRLLGIDFIDDHDPSTQAINLKQSSQLQG